MRGVVLVNCAVVGFSVSGELIELSALYLRNIKFAVAEVYKVLGAAGFQELRRIYRVAIVVGIVIELIILGLNETYGTVITELVDNVVARIVDPQRGLKQSRLDKMLFSRVVQLDLHINTGRRT